MELKDRLEQIKKEFDETLDNTVEKSGFDDLYLKYFSKKHGKVTELIKNLPELAAEEKKKYGPMLNQLQNELKQKIDDARVSFEEELLKDPLIDLSLPEKPQKTGMMHPTNQVIREINSFFRYYGYSIEEGPEIETAENNFRKLNLPEGHPATDLQDTLFIEEPNILLRTHTSSIEARILTQQNPPIRAAFPGKCYRNETPNPTNSAFFHQYQGVVVDKGVTIKNLFAVLEDFHKFLFGDDVEIRFRYKYYPEVSPGVGTDMKCKFCNGEGCTVCKYRGWIEVLGSGMIHYNTLKMCGIDPEIYTGFAFGIGLDRMVMQRFEIDDIRKLYGKGVVYY